MTSPFADGTVLPMDAPPMPVSPHGDVTKLRSDRVHWQRRAAVAEDAGMELAEAVTMVRGSFRSNYFGDCIEGRQFHVALTRALTDLAAELTHQSDTALLISKQCVHAADAIGEADDRGAQSIEA